MRRLSPALVFQSPRHAWFSLRMHSEFPSPCDQGASQDVLAVVDRELPRFNAVNMATAVSRMAKQQAAPDVIMHAAEQPAFTRLKAAISALHPCTGLCDSSTAFAGLKLACTLSYVQHSGSDADEEACIGLSTARHQWRDVASHFQCLPLHLAAKH